MENFANGACVLLLYVRTQKSKGDARERTGVHIHAPAIVMWRCNFLIIVKQRERESDARRARIAWPIEKLVMSPPPPSLQAIFKCARITSDRRKKYYIYYGLYDAWAPHLFFFTSQKKSFHFISLVYVYVDVDWCCTLCAHAMMMVWKFCKSLFYCIFICTKHLFFATLLFIVVC